MITKKEIKWPRYYQCTRHKIRRHLIEKTTLQVVYELKKNGYQTYVVGGCLRDILLHKKPKDFDVVTNASPEKIKRLFPRAIIIGRRFKLVHIHIGNNIVEVSTFRAHKPSFLHIIKSFFVRETCKYHKQNIFGTIEEDAYRRDITINSLYYDPDSQQIVDYAGGYTDIKDKIVRVIGKTNKRFIEDPMRILRVLRFCAKLGLAVSPETERAIIKYSKEINKLPGARLFDEFTKLLLNGHAYASWKWLSKYNIFKYIIYLSNWNNITDAEKRMLEQALKSTDKRYRQNKSLTPVFLLAAFLWIHYCEEMKKLDKNTLQKQKFITKHKLVCEKIAAKQKETMPIPLRYFWRIEKIWLLQDRMLNYKKINPAKIFENKNFRIAYDFLEVRSYSDSKIKEAYIWWNNFIKENKSIIQEKKANKSIRIAKNKQNLSEYNKSKNSLNYPAHVL